MPLLPEVSLRGACRASSLRVANSCTLTPAAGSANETRVTIQFKDARGNALAAPVNTRIYLSDDADGIGITGTTASGTVGVYSSGNGAVLTALTASKHLAIVTTATGKFVLTITDTAKTAFKVCAVNPTTGQVHLVTLATANYG